MLSIGDIAVLARQAGMTYGEFVARYPEKCSEMPKRKPGKVIPIQDKTTRECVVCGKLFVIRTASQKTCSAVCSTERNRQRNRESWAKNKHKYGRA